MSRLTALECVVNVSEGRDDRALGVLAGACGNLLLDLHSDPDHHRSVLTLAGPSDDLQEAARSLARAAVATLDLSRHVGAHPRVGVIDVVPFVPLGALASGASGAPGPQDLGAAVDARDSFAAWAAEALGLPCFLYGPLPGGGTRSLPEVRRSAFSGLSPDTGPPRAHPTAGAAAVGARQVLVAYNLWLAGTTVDVARRVARAVRGPTVRALGFDLGHGVQVSCNLLDPTSIGPAEVYDRVAELLSPATDEGCVSRAELVGLMPAAALDRVPRRRWEELDLGAEKTIEARLEGRLEGRAG